MHRTNFGSIAVIAIIATLALALTPPAAAQEWSKYGGYVDEIVMKTIRTADAQSLALKAGEIDVIGVSVEPGVLSTMLGYPEIKLTYADHTRFRHISFNTQIFPGNFSAVRRAVAFAMDKNKIVDEVNLGFALLLDSPILSFQKELSIEAELPWHYYDMNLVDANIELTSVGFVDTDGDGIREFDPDGDGVGADLNNDGTFDDDVRLDVWTSAGCSVCTNTVEVTTEGIRAMGLLSDTVVNPWELIVGDLNSELINLFPATTFSWVPGRDPTLFWYIFRTGNPDNDDIYRFSNAEMDVYLDQYFMAQTQEDLVEGLRGFQEIFHEEQPFIPAYQYMGINAFRTNKFTNWITCQGFAMLRCTDPFLLARQVSGEFGGLIRASVEETLESMNWLTTSSGYVADYMSFIYEGLYGFNPITWKDVPGTGLSESWTIEVVDDPSLGEIYKMTFNLLENATWHDGMPVTAEDVAFSHWLFNFTQSPNMYPSMLFWINTTVVDTYTAVIYDSNPSIFEFHTGPSGLPVFPKHIWNDPANYGEASMDDVEASEILAWDPAADGKLIGSGKYQYKTHSVADEIWALEVYPDHPYSVRNWPELFEHVATGPGGAGAGGVNPGETEAGGVVVQGETFDADQYTGLTLTTEWEAVFGNNTLLVAGLGIVGLIIGAAVGLLGRRRE